MASILLDLVEFKRRGADGFVFAALSLSTEIDKESCRWVVDAAAPLPVTFHRAFDVLKGDPEVHLKTIIGLGFKRLLTSGQKSNAVAGLQDISKWNKDYGGDITIMPGAGVNPENLSKIIRESGCREFHSSCKEQSKIAVDPIIGDLERSLLTNLSTVQDLVAVMRQEEQ